LPAPLVQYAALPAPLPTQQCESPDHVERPRYPNWEKAKLVFHSLSLLSGVIIFGVAIAYGIQTAELDQYDLESADILMGTSGTAVRS
jgi:hypothetical protein